jgi:hypothetical protein
MFFKHLFKMSKLNMERIERESSKDCICGNKFDLEERIPTVLPCQKALCLICYNEALLPP